MAKFWSCLLCEIITLGVRCHSQNWQILPKLLEILRRCLLCEVFPSLSRCHSKDLAFLPKELDCFSRSVLLKDWVKLNAIQSLKYNLIETRKQYFWGLKSSVSYELRGIWRDGVLLFCGGGKEDRTPCINPYLLIKPAIRVHIRVQHSKIHIWKKKDQPLSDM